MRATYLRSLLARCDELGPAGVEVRDRLGDARQTSIECAGPLVWLPIEADVAVQRALDEILGAEQARSFMISSLRELWSGSAIQPVVFAATGLFGLNPGSFAKLVPLAWSLLYRDCGRWVVSDSQRVGSRREVEMQLLALPEPCAVEPAWLAAVVTVLHGLLVLCDVEGEVELGERDPKSDLASFKLSWG